MFNAILLFTRGQKFHVTLFPFSSGLYKNRLRYSLIFAGKMNTFDKRYCANGKGRRG